MKIFEYAQAGSITANDLVPFSQRQENGSFKVKNISGSAIGSVPLESSFTPTIEGVSVSANTGYMYKIGKLAYVYFQLTLPVTTGNTDPLVINGTPDNVLHDVASLLSNNIGTIANAVISSEQININQQGGSPFTIEQFSEATISAQFTVIIDPQT